MMTQDEMTKRLNTAYEQIDKAQQMLIWAKVAVHEVRCAKAEQPAKPTGWISVAERMPKDEQRVPIRTTSGATYFLHPIGGKFPADVKEWYELPE